MSSIIWINIPVSPKRVLHTNMLLVCPCYLYFYGYWFAISSRPWTSLVVCARYWVSLKSASFFAPDALLATLLRDGSTFSFLCSFCASMMPFFTVLNSPRNWWVVSAWRGFNNVNPYLPCYYLNFLSFSQVCFKVSLEIFPCLFFWSFSIPVVFSFLEIIRIPDDVQIYFNYLSDWVWVLSRFFSHYYIFDLCKDND